MNSRLNGLFTALSLASLAVVVGCASEGPKTLGALRYQPEPEPSADVATSASHQEVRTEYEELIDLVDDEHLKEQIERRIAHVYMLEGEQDQSAIDSQAEIEPGKSYYVDAIKSYREVLEKYPNSPDNAEILYQLAKAYDMEADQDEALAMLEELTRRHPQYENIAEAQFRKGDILFNRGAYEEAERSYRAVTARGDSKFNLNAHYMLGWSQYKQLQFRQALDSYVHVLNRLLAPTEELKQLSQPNQSLVTDTLHAVSLSLDKVAGAASIQSLPELTDRHYVWMVYDDLGQYYLEKELFEASAETYRLFVKHYGDNDRAPVLHQKMIETYVAGSFPRQAFEEKENFVDAYGIYSAYARQRGGAVESIRPTMESYLDELARNYHARGQELQTEIEELQTLDDDVPDAVWKKNAEEAEELDEEAVAALNKASYYYLQFIESFPEHESLDEYVFHRAEALFAARRYEDSIPGYERVAYQAGEDVTAEYGANAGYAAIVAYENHVSKLSEQDAELAEWRAQAVDSMLRFAEQYHQDERSASVLTNAAEYMFTLEQYPRALEIATSLVENNANLDPTLQETAYGIMAHSLFQLERFAEAGERYQQQREFLEEDGEEYQRVTERLASAIYKHSETVIASDEKLAAAEELLRLKALAPDSPVRITGQYDAASLLIELKLWSRAIPELRELIESYPDHELAVEFPRKLAFAYEENGDWQLAAEEYLNLSEADPDPENRREALYLAASMYEKDENHDAAIAQLKAYNQQYPQPFSVRMEARYKLAQNYRRIGDQEKRLYWLQALVDGDGEAGEQSTERSRWLAAWANAEYGDHHAAAFHDRDLSLPLDKSLSSKNEQMDKATRRYQMAADSGIFEFVTMSAYKIGELYHELATELRESPRPDGLGADERAFYTEILEEQAQPLDQVAMDLHQSNVERGWDGEFDQWIDQSFQMMRRLNPARFAKAEVIVSYDDEIR